MKDLHGKRLHVTGAGRGIGEAIARLAAERGARVMCSDVDADAAARVAGELGEGAASTSCDVSSAEQLGAAVQATVDALGGLDAMVNNAGIEITAPLVEMEESDFDRIMSINVKGVFLGMKAAVPALVEGGGGTIVNLASIAGTGGVPMLGAYCASKAAVLRMTETAARELREMGIRVNAVAPGLIGTGMLDRLESAYEGVLPISWDEVIATKQGRPATAPEVAEAVCYLASEDSTFVTGATFVLDNAMTASAL